MIDLGKPLLSSVHAGSIHYNLSACLLAALADSLCRSLMRALHNYLFTSFDGMFNRGFFDEVR
jgi:hypothetical protein